MVLLWNVMSVCVERSPLTFFHLYKAAFSLRENKQYSPWGDHQRWASWIQLHIWSDSRNTWCSKSTHGISTHYSCLLYHCDNSLRTIPALRPGFTMHIKFLLSKKFLVFFFLETDHIQIASFADIKHARIDMRTRTERTQAHIFQSNTSTRASICIVNKPSER